jgi:kynurenine formamidase
MSREYEIPTTAALDQMYEDLKNWDRWGADDERGALNYMTDDRRREASRLVTSGESISLSHDLGTEPLPEHPHPVQHHMLASGDARDSNGIPGYEAARDHLSLDIHGLHTTHVDALSHMFVRGEMFGGRPASEVRSDGARSNTVLSMADGVVGRGVLLDIPRAMGREFLDSGEVVTVAELEAAEAAQAVRVSEGDVLLIAWGREARRVAKGQFDGFSGLHAECGTPRWPFPVHQIGITSIGLHLIDNVALARLGDQCAALGRWAFLFTMAPLRITRGTGCPVNPVAVL